MEPEEGEEKGRMRGGCYGRLRFILNGYSDTSSIHGVGYILNQGTPTQGIQYTCRRG